MRQIGDGSSTGISREALSGRSSVGEIRETIGGRGNVETVVGMVSGSGQSRWKVFCEKVYKVAL